MECRGSVLGTLAWRAAHAQNGSTPKNSKENSGVNFGHKKIQIKCLGIKKFESLPKKRI
jgi:hypothetical protein